MGAWGYSPYEDDTASDWLSGLLPKVRKALKSSYEQEALVATAFLTDYLGNHVDVAEEAQLAIGRLTKIRDDEEFIGSFSDPARKQKAINAQLDKLTRLCNKWS